VVACGGAQTFEDFEKLEKLVTPESGVDKIYWGDDVRRPFPQSRKYLRVTVEDKARIPGCVKFLKGICQNYSSFEVVQVLTVVVKKTNPPLICHRRA
jgi:hypothetical protein